MPRKHTNLIVVIGAALLAGSAIAADSRERHAHSFAKDVDAFHSVLAPLWHARVGKGRSQNVCAQSDKLERLAKAIHSANAKPLLTSIAALKTQCQTAPADIDAVFAQVHEAFHHLTEPQEN